MITASDAPGPKGHVFSGNLREYTSDPLGFLTECFRTYGDVVRLRFVNIPVYLITRPDLVESVLVTHRANFIKARTRRTMRRVFGNGLLMSEGEEWCRQRRLWQSAFGRERIEAYGEKVASCAGQMLYGLKDGQTHDIYRQMSRFTLEILSRTLVESELVDRPDQIRGALDILLDHYADLTPLGVLLPESFPTPGTLRAQRAIRELERIVHAIIRDRRTRGSGANDFLSLLQDARERDGSEAAIRQFRDELMTILLVGHETSGVALSWCWYLLSQNPGAEARLASELREVLGGRMPGPADLPRLHYAEAIVLESMRLYPPIYAFGREAVQDCEIGGYGVPAGASVFFSQWVMHRDPRYFACPEKFDPDRWTTGSTKRLPKYAYLPFGAGPRNCVGASFAMMEIVLLLAAIAQRFRITVAPGHIVIPQASFTLRPKNGIPAVLSSRPEDANSVRKPASSGATCQALR